MDTQNILIIIYSILTIIFFIKIIPKNAVFGMVYIFLFLYSIFSMVAYVNFPERMSKVSNGQYYGKEFFYQFYAYIFIFMILTYVFHVILKKLSLNIYASAWNIKIRDGNFFFKILLFIILIYLSINAIVYYPHASYYNQGILKSNKIWFFLFCFSGAIVIILSNLLIRTKREEGKLQFIYLIYLVAYIIILLVTSLMFGQRIEIIETLLGSLIMSLEYQRRKNNYEKIPIKKLIKIGIIVLIIVMFISQFVRTYRGNHISTFKLNVYYILENIIASQIMDFQFFIFQDWLIPSLGLATCMKHNFIDPSLVIYANSLNIFSFITNVHVSLTSPIKDLFDPFSKMGYGFYFPTEGYVLCGYYGCIVSAFLISFYYKVYEQCFNIKDDKDLNCLLCGIRGFYIISIVRNYSLFFIKGVCYYIIPALILYILATGKGIKLKIGSWR